MALLRKSDRRRRLLVDAATAQSESLQASPSQVSKPKSNAGSMETRLYTIAAERRHQRKTTDLIPKRRLAYTYTVVAFLLALVGLNLLAIYSPNWVAAIGNEGVKAFAIWGPGTLAGWVATVCWAMASATCMQIFVIRRHRNDDYVGTYRVWGWMAIVCLVGSLVCNVNAAAVLANLIAALTSISISDPNWLPAAMVGILSSLIAIRVLLEVRCSYGTIAWVVLAWTAVNTASLVNVMGSSGDGATSQLADGSLSSDLWVGNAMLILAVGVLMSTVTYARFVFLRANGLVKVTQRSAIGVEEEHEVDVNESENEKRSTKPRKAKPANAKTTRKVVKPESATVAKGKAETSEDATPDPKTAEAAATAAKPVVFSVQVNQAPPSNKQPDPAPVAVSASEKLRALAAASRAKQTLESEAETDSADESSNARTLRMSKAEKRKQRKNQKQNRRAA